jgi:hypothetical protein
VSLAIQATMALAGAGDSALRLVHRQSRVTGSNPLGSPAHRTEYALEPEQAEHGL